MTHHRYKLLYAVALVSAILSAAASLCLLDGHSNRLVATRTPLAIIRPWPRAYLSSWGHQKVFPLRSPDAVVFRSTPKDLSSTSVQLTRAQQAVLDRVILDEGPKGTCLASQARRCRVPPDRQEEGGAERSSDGKSNPGLVDETSRLTAEAARNDAVASESPSHWGLIRPMHAPLGIMELI